MCVERNDRKGNILQGVGACFRACDFTQPNACPNGLLCARFNATLSLCISPFPECPDEFIGNNQCDDTRDDGSRVCEMGSDPDCE